MKKIIEIVEELKEKAYTDIVPIYYSNDEASAWLDGYLTALETVLSFTKEMEN